MWLCHTTWWPCTSPGSVARRLPGHIRKGLVWSETIQKHCVWGVMMRLCEVSLYGVGLWKVHWHVHMPPSLNDGLCMCKLSLSDLFLQVTIDLYIFFLTFCSLLPIYFQVGCMPWGWSSNSSSSIVIISPGGTNETMSELPCDAAHYAFLSCVVGTLTLAIFLRVSSLPKMILLLFVTILYIVILELSGYRKAVG